MRQVTLSLAELFYRPPLSVVVVGLVLVIALAALGLSAYRERARWTALLRFAALAGLGWMLMGPSLTRPTPPSNPDPPRLAILTDTSESMAQRDSTLPGTDQPATRLQAVAAAWLDDDRLGRLRSIAKVDLYTFDDQLRSANRADVDPPDGPSTRLYDAVARTRADATLILSDGHDTTPLTRAPATPEAGRLFAVPVGTPRSAPDLALDAWPDSDQLFEGQRTTITATIRRHGFADQPVVVELEHNGQTTQTQTQTLTLDQAETAARFTIEPSLPPGRAVQAQHYRVRVRLVEGEEAYLDNNAQDVFVQVSRGKVRVLMLEGEPYWDTRSLGRLIGAHPQFDLTALYAFGDRRRTRVFGETDEPGTDPVQRVERYDIIILGRRVDRLVDRGFAERLDGFVREGGAVVFARGDAFGDETERGRTLREGVAALSPGRWGGSVLGEMRVRLSEAGDTPAALDQLTDEAVISRLPGMIAATRLAGRKAASVVLLEQQQDEGPAMAALTTMRVGAGTAMAVLTEGLWRWELLPGADQADQADAPDADRLAESAYAGFWVRALQWLASGGDFLPGQDIALRADRLTLEPGATVTLRVNTRYVETDNLDLELTAIDAQGERQPLALSPGSLPGQFTAAYTPQQAGIVRFELTAPQRDDLIAPDQPLTTQVAAVERSPEKRDTAAQPDRLRRLTEPTGGRCLGFDEPEPLIDYLQTLHDLRRAPDTADYAFNTWPVFAWLVGCFGLEWVLRRRSGLR